MADKVFCPWCGSMMRAVLRTTDDGFLSWYECPGCDAQGPSGKAFTRTGALKTARDAAWHRYVPQHIGDELPGPLEVIMSLIDQAQDKHSLTNDDPDSVFANDERMLYRAAALLDEYCIEEPNRVLAMQEILAMPEEIRGHGVALWTEIYNAVGGHWDDLDLIKISLTRRGQSPEVRYWLRKPTEEERKAVPWDE